MSRNDMANVSYFPGREVESNAEAEWIEASLIPVINAVAARRAKKIRETPIGFWVCIRETARLPQGEIFVFCTPWRTGKQTEDAVRNALTAIPNGKIFQGTERIPEEAIPCCQSFRGKIIRFFGDFENNGTLGLPLIRWQGNAPSLQFQTFDASKAVVHENEDPQEIYVRAKMSGVADGTYYRSWQGGLRSVAMLEE